jgi:hypothetical protein
MAREGKRNSRSYLREEIRAIEDVKALLIELNQQRIAIKRAAWASGDEEAYRTVQKQKVTLIRLKRIFSRYYTDLNVQLEEEE